ncbi:MAG: hypothetical protein JW737_04225 [Acidobacteria bacterium]|nr:hypothetical protein [Acidobacteriota bacterium]
MNTDIAGSGKIVYWTCLQYWKRVFIPLGIFILIFFFDISQEKGQFFIGPVGTIIRIAVILLILSPFLASRVVINLKKKLIKYTWLSKPGDRYTSERLPFSEIRSFQITQDKKRRYILSAELNNGGMKEITRFNDLSKMKEHALILQMETGKPVIDNGCLQQIFR